MNDAIAIEGGQSTPSVWLEVRGAQTKQLEGVEAGTGIRVVLEGKVTSVTERDVDGLYSGTVEVEYSRLKFLPESNQFADLVMEEGE